MFTLLDIHSSRIFVVHMHNCERSQIEKQAFLENRIVKYSYFRASNCQ